MASIYVSSTFDDLKECRQKVSNALRRLGHEDVAMEYYVAEDQRPLDRCLCDAAACNVYVGIFAFRYGYVPRQGNPEQRSITELEYRQASGKGTTCLIFLLSEDAPWPKSKQDKGAAAEHIERLRQGLSERHTGKRQLIDWETYRQAVYDKHQWVRLQVIAGASKQGGVIRIPLTEVFQPQLAAKGASTADVPDEVRKYQDAIYGPRPVAAEEDTSVEEGPERSDEAAELETEGLLLSSNSEVVLDLIGREPHQVILGGPGSGKSTVLHYAMLRVCQAGVGRDALPEHLRNAPAPFLIELRNYVLRKVPDFITYIVGHSKDFYDATIDAESLETLLRQEREALVFFDGLDEVFDPDERRRVIEQFQTFARRYPQACIVVTSRIAGYDRTALGVAGFEHYTLLPLTLGHIRHFADKWYQYYTLEGTERTAHGLVQRIVENPRLLDLAGNPLLLTMMAVIYKDRDLPNERWRLYERCAETLLEDWDLGKGFEDEDFKLDVLIKTKQKSEILQLVSMYMLEHNQKGRELNAVAYAPLLTIMAGYLEEKYQRPRGEAEAVAVDILRHLMERTYVLAGIGERIFGFVHRTFMEYFAACRCQAQFNALKSDFDWLTRGIFGKYWQTAEWEEVLLLLIAMLHDQGTPIREVVEHIRSECRTKVPFNVAFAARCLGEAGDVQDLAHAQELLTELAQAIAEFASRRGRDAQRFVETALKAFATLAPLVAAPAAVQDAIDRLNQTRGVAVRMAAWQMGFALRSRKERLSYALAALGDKEEVVRRGAISALEREWPGRADIIPLLIEVVRTDRVGRVRQAALAAMQRSWRQEPAILDTISDRADEETAHTHVVWLIEYLAETWRGNPAAFQVVLKLVGRKPESAWGSYYAPVVWEAVGRAAAKGWRGNPQAATSLRDWAVNDPDPYARVGAIKAIGHGWGGDPRTLAFLRDLAASDSVPKVRAGAVEAIASGWGGDPRALAFLQDRAANDSEPQTREAALGAIASGWGGDSQASTFLQDQAARAPDPKTRAAALRATATGWGGDPQALAFLQLRAVSDPGPQARAAALGALATGWHGDRQVMAFLQDRAVSDTEPQARVGALKAITNGWGGDTQALAFLRDRASNDPEPNARVGALKAIANTWPFDPQALALLQDRAVSEAEPQARVGALEAITDGWGGDLQALTFLQDRAVSDPEPQVRAAALLATRDFVWRDPEALAFLRERAVSDPEPEARAAGLRAMQGFVLRGQPSLAFLRERAVGDPEPQVRAAALSAMQGFAWHEPLLLAFLQDRAVSDSEPQVRAAALLAMSGFVRGGDLQALAFLRDRAVSDPDEGTRMTALRAEHGYLTPTRDDADSP